mmetsp:Transcript_25583/g.29278  ORF Transcript_25583/g.29278 Transcript_25583/m.29278 type:complete len:372 (-) Transcript_25583:1-1116(-)
MCISFVITNTSLNYYLILYKNEKWHHPNNRKIRITFYMCWAICISAYFLLHAGNAKFNQSDSQYISGLYLCPMYLFIVLVLVGSCDYYVSRNPRRTKFLIVTGLVTTVLQSVAFEFLPILANLEEREVVLLGFPFFISLLEETSIKVLAKLKIPSNIPRDYLLIITRTVLMQIAGMKYGFIVYSFKPQTAVYSLINLATNSVNEVCSRCRIWALIRKKLFYRCSRKTRSVISIMTQSSSDPSKSNLLPPRAEISELYQGGKIEAQTIPLISLLMILWLNWVPLVQKGNHLNSKAEPDPDLLLPWYMYLAFFLMEASNNIVSWLLGSRYEYMAIKRNGFCTLGLSFVSVALLYTHFIYGLGWISLALADSDW